MIGHTIIRRVEHDGGCFNYKIVKLCFIKVDISSDKYLMHRKVIEFIGLVIW